jgi:hypothetical protein
MIKKAIGYGGSAFAVAGLLLAPGDVSARGFMFPHAGLHRGHHFIYAPYGYGYTGPVATYTPGDYGTPVIVLPAQATPAAAPAPHCVHSRETVTVPAEAGGERKVTITRC